MSDLKPIAVVTGASSGIGAVYADRLAARGYNLVLVARRAARLEGLSTKLLDAYGTKVEVIAADLTTEDGLVRVEAELAGNPAIALLVNNAGNGKLGSTVAMSDEDAASTIALNITALTRLTRAVLPPFLARNQGAIINIASSLSFEALPTTSLYSGTKAYVMVFSHGLQQELAGTNVRVQLVMPAGIVTEFYEQSGIDVAAFDPAMMMTAENMVDASLAGFDQGEANTLPSVEDGALWDVYDTARAKLFAATQTGRPASRYGVALAKT